MKVPPESPWHKPTDDGEPNVPDEPVTVPEWAESAWRALEVDPELGDALAAHQEGLALEQRHPSFALLAFIASIEALGTKLFPVDRCPECKTVRGAAERFRKTLRLVLPEDQVRTLARAYTPRSTTAHRGKLHGVERAFGSLDTAGFSVIGRMMRAMALPAGLQFSWGTVYEMRRASNALLQKALMGNLNPDDGS